MTKNKQQKLIMNLLGTKPVAFNPDLAHALNSAKAGLFLSQLLYWCDKGRNPEWIYKTIDEVERETTLSRREQETAIKICKKHDLIKMEVRGIPAKRHFKLNIEKIIELLQKYIFSLSESDKQVRQKTTNKSALNEQTNTENTPNITIRDSHLTGEANQRFADDFLLKDEINAYKQGKRFKERPYFRGDPMRWVKNEKQWYVINKYNEWLEFAGKESEIEWNEKEIHNCLIIESSA